MRLNFPRLSSLGSDLYHLQALQYLPRAPLQGSQTGSCKDLKGREALKDRDNDHRRLLLPLTPLFAFQGFQGFQSEQARH
jgi:hypothetical protein